MCSTSYRYFANPLETVAELNRRWRKDLPVRRCKLDPGLKAPPCSFTTLWIAEKGYNSAFNLNPCFV